MSDDKIINRVKKLMALAADPAASDGERDNALRMAHATILKYNLDMNDVQGRPTGPQESRMRASSEFYGRPWALSLCNSIADLFFCNYMYRRSAKKNHVFHEFVGKESNAQSAMEVAEVLVASIFREGSRRMRQEGENVTWRRSFCTGAAMKIMDRVRSLKSESVKGTGTALMVVGLYDSERQANALFLRQSGVVTRVAASRAKRDVHAGAYGAGKDFAANLPLAPTKKLGA